MCVCRGSETNNKEKFEQKVILYTSNTVRLREGEKSAPPTFRSMLLYSFVLLCRLRAERSFFVVVPSLRLFQGKRKRKKKVTEGRSHTLSSLFALRREDREG